MFVADAGPSIATFDRVTVTALSLLDSRSRYSGERRKLWMMRQGEDDGRAVFGSKRHPKARDIYPYLVHLFHAVPS